MSDKEFFTVLRFELEHFRSGLRHKRNKSVQRLALGRLATASDPENDLIFVIRRHFINWLQS